MNQTITSTNEERMSAYDSAIAEGAAHGLQSALIGVLEARSLTISSTQRARIFACTDAAVLNELIPRAVTVDSVAVLLGDV